ncbi:hypothetical protein [Pseudomonas sp. MWU12-2345]|uniref:hypothetical protein n=1 Tax=Pseudomonas sp. MWU12-2345 TaxID=2928689 RepID=UPI002010A7B4|nr:hypothetical protein [Pseudomonas sp. MWU12-2345]
MLTRGACSVLKAFSRASHAGTPSYIAPEAYGGAPRPLLEREPLKVWRALAFALKSPAILVIGEVAASASSQVQAARSSPGLRSK